MFLAFFAVLSVQKWCHQPQQCYWPANKLEMHTLVHLARARSIDKNGKRTMSRYPQSCLQYLSDELLKYIFGWLISDTIQWNPAETDFV
jgi:hypothetical protein